MIHITGDTNHHAPAFSRSEYAFTVGEERGNWDVCGPAEAADFDDGLNVMASESCPKQHGHLRITILDENDNAPQFTQVMSYSQTIPEGTPAGQRVAQITATDSDIDPHNSHVTYRIQCPVSDDRDDGDCLEVFTLDAMTGSLRLNQPLNYESRSRYDLLVLAVDQIQISPSQKTSTTTLTIRVLDENDQTIYSVRVSESAAAGTMLVQTVALDADSVDSEISYAIVTGTAGNTEDKIFRVNRFGQIYLNYPLDYERAAVHNLTVRAFERDYPEHGGVATVLIEVEDANDNAPLFSEFIRRRLGWRKMHRLELLWATDQAVDTTLRQSSEKAITILIDDINDHAPVFTNTRTVIVPEYANSGYRLLTVAAVDRDAERNGHVTFDLTRTADMERFQLDRYDGHIYLRGELRLIAPLYTLTVVARDQSGDGRQSTVMNIDLVTASRVGAEKTVAFTQNVYEWTVTENERIGAEIGQGFGQTIDQFCGTAGVLSDWVTSTNGDVVPCVFDVDQTSGAVMLKGQLGAIRGGDVPFASVCRGEGIFQLSSHCYNGQANLARNSTATIRITILDENDNAPQFTQSSYSQTVPEGTPAGQRVAQITATDSDIDPHNSHVTYRIQCPVSDDRDDGDCLEVFTLDAMTGSLRLNQPLNYESRSRYDLLVLAVDQIQTSPSQKTSTTILTIRVLDENDQTIYSVRVSESAAAGTMLVQTVALDADSVDSEISYAIVTGTAGNTEDKIFRVNRFGQIYLNYPLDYERAAVHNLTVRAFERDYPEHGGVATVLIEVEDANDNAPLFSEFIKTTIRVAENAPAGAVVATTLAHDEDSGVNGEVRYSILYAEPINNHFQINEETGQISTTVALDRELYSSYRLVLQATDQAVDTTLRQSSEKAITILIDDINDHAPVFTNTRTVIVPEYANSGYRLLTVAAVDRDAERNGHVTFDLTRTADMERFQLDRYDGHIYLRGELRLIAPLYTLTVVARDQSGDGRQSTVMNIDLVTASRVGAEKTVAFTQNVYEWTVTENERIGAEIGRVSAKLLTNSAGPLEYFLTGVTSANGDVVPCVFDVDQTSGAVMLKGQLDADSGAATFLLQVYAGVKGFSNYQVTASQV
ncbi:Protocadherin Fat 4 [Hypsibius exemplaris]|uniref:Protocadherin Fat 4 n=1 Tax=Hypsibius exemplaris TaxID=2072580 RepID=A0A1W0X201_HYPEX|nr:Protocadherin Fat 4 [Hypsibius exemplaris]